MNHLILDFQVAAGPDQYGVQRLLGCAGTDSLFQVNVHLVNHRLDLSLANRNVAQVGVQLRQSVELITQDPTPHFGRVAERCFQDCQLLAQILR